MLNKWKTIKLLAWQWQHVHVMQDVELASWLLVTISGLGPCHDISGRSKGKKRVEMRSMSCAAIFHHLLRRHLPRLHPIL
jgi:hypothetical protein